MIFELEVQNERKFPVDRARLRQAVETVLSAHAERFTGRAPALTIVLTDDDSVRALNHEFRGVDQPTDVLSFPSPPLPPVLSEETQYLGDLVIAYPYAAAQAEREGHPLPDSLSLLVVHGTLHLLGYDHADADGRAIMWAAQGRALTALGISLDIVPALEQASHDEPTSF